MANEASAQTLLMLCEAIAVDAIAATASGFVVMSPMELFGLVTQVYDFLSLDLLYVGQIQSLMMRIQSAQLNVALSEEELTMVNMIVADFSVLIVTIQSSITIIKVPLAEEVKVDILEENKESTNTTLGFMDGSSPGRSSRSHYLRNRRDDLDATIHACYEPPHRNLFKLPHHGRSMPSPTTTSYDGLWFQLLHE